MPLSDTAVRHARATGKAYTLVDGRGLALNVAANGRKAGISGTARLADNAACP